MLLTSFYGSWLCWETKCTDTVTEHFIESNVTKTFQAGVINISGVTAPIIIFSAKKIQNRSAVF